MKRQTIFSPCRRYRYSLWREWGDLLDKRTEYVTFLCLNPSIADCVIDDPTVRRCIRFTSDWGYTWLCVLNLFGFRATDPKVMLAEPNPVGDDNDGIIVQIVRESALVITAWGCHGSHMGRDKEVMKLLTAAKIKLHCLRQTNGVPHHPLYLPGDLKPIPFP